MPEKSEKTLRNGLEYVNLSQQWSHTVPNYTKQYCNIYLVRLQQMTQLLEERIEKKWGKTYPVCKLHKLSTEKLGKCVVIGTLFKNQKLKPSILKQLAEGNQLVPQPILTHFTDPSDCLFIEDELQRYQLISNISCDNLVTGISCALLGTADDKGKFSVEDYIFAGCREQIPRPILEDSAYVVFISGLDLVNAGSVSKTFHLFILWISGLVELHNFPIASIVRVIIAGNCIRSDPEEVKSSISLLSRQPDSAATFEAVQQFDNYLADIGETIEVDVMPGENDPSNRILPQKPMHFCLFPEASLLKSVKQVSNPYYASIGGVRIMGTSGQNVRDVMRYSEIQTPLEVLEACLEWSHIAPTAPDTLGCFPFYDKDPFVFEDCPHVLFVGNQNEFSTKEYTGEDGQKVTLLCLPDFKTTSQACIFDLKTFGCELVSFNVK